MTAKKMGRPFKGDEKLEHKVATLLTKEQKERLEEIAAEKRWSIATLVSYAIENTFPSVFGKKEK
jgi:hypothetical protein